MIMRAPLAGWIELGVVFPGVKSVAEREALRDICQRVHFNFTSHPREGQHSLPMPEHPP
jgi:hypothetical protein